MKRSLLIFAACISLSCGAEEIHLEEVVVYGHSATQIGQTISASEGTVSQEDLAIRPLLRTGEILEAVPGLVATQHSGSGKANQYFLRGFNLDHGTDFSTNIDAMPINMRTHGHGQGYTDLNFLIPELIGGIHYKKGPYYADAGDFSGTGSADITSTDHLDTTLSQGLGENNFYRSLLMAETNFAAGKLLAAAEYQTYAGPWESVNEDVRKKNVWLKQLWDSDGEKYALEIMAYSNHWNSADQIPARAVDEGIISYLGSIDSTLGGTSSRYSISGNMEQQLNEHSYFSANIYAIDYQLNLWSNFSYFTQPDGDQFEQTDKRRIYGGDLKIDELTNFWDKQMVNTVGLQIRSDIISEVGLTHTLARTPLNPIRTDAVNESSNSVYWQNKWQLSDRLRSQVGVRYDYFTFDVNPRTAFDKDSIHANSGNTSADIVTADGSLIYRLAQQEEIYASIGQGFHSNDARGVSIKMSPLNGEAVNSVDPLVKTLGYEIGWRGTFTEKLNTSIALWHLRINSELLYVGDEGITEDTGIGSTRNGVEWTAYYHPAPDWTLDLEYAYTEAQFNSPRDGSREIPGALKQVLTTGVNWQITENFFSDIKWRHFNGYPLDAGANAKGSDLVNIRFGYTLNQHLKFTLDLLNALNSKDHDIEYFYESQLPGEAAPVADHHYHVFEPRSVRLYIGWTF